jgi:alpha-galactosidase
MKPLQLLILIFAIQPAFAQKFDDLALTPPMGWNSWNQFGCRINENLVREMADAMIESGMKESGYRYIVIDDCWQSGRDSAGNIIVDEHAFPSGIKALADYIHSRGLKFGLYSDGGVKTCAGRPGSRGYEFQDARTYASWGVDYLKYDWCYSEGQNAEASYRLMRDALFQAGRPVVFSMCEWGSNEPWLWAREIAHLWRTTGDISDCFSCESNWGSMGVMQILDLQVKLRSYAGPGHWNDPDMLEVGNDGLNFTEAQAHFGLWCLLSAPLMAGNNLKSMPEEIAGILCNKEVIAIDQDPLGRQALKWMDYGDMEIWLKPLENGDFAIGILNRGNEKILFDKSLQLTTYDTDFKPNSYTYRINENYNIRDLWNHKQLGDTKINFRTEIESHQLILLRLSKK